MIDNQPRACSLEQRLFVRVLKFFMSFVGKVTVSGLEHIDSATGKVIVCNHISLADPLWIGCALFPRRLHQMAKKELFENPFSAWFVRSGGGFPVDRGRPSAATIKYAVSLVAAGELLLIFPTGTRGQEHVSAKRGAAAIAIRGKAQIIPAYYEGPEKFRIAHLFRRPPIRITFGPPIEVAADDSSDKAFSLQVTTELDRAMKALAVHATTIKHHEE
jgi:1-acyl-sn-glycerol-3-phosphate acyltransferase